MASSFRTDDARLGNFCWRHRVFFPAAHSFCPECATTTSPEDITTADLMNLEWSLNGPSLERALELVDELLCTPACLFARGKDEGCTCCCDGEYHGWARRLMPVLIPKDF